MVRSVTQPQKKPATWNSPLAASEIVDLNDIIIRWITYMRDLKRSGCVSGIFKTGKRKHFDLDQLEIDLSWNNVNFTQEEGSFHMVNAVAKNFTQQTLFTTSFVNRTGKEQENSFKTERETCQSYEVTFNRGYSRETYGQLKIPFLKNVIRLVIPADILEFNGGIKKELSIENGENQITEESITWQCDTKIQVKPGSKVTGSLKITELEMERTFSGVCFIEGRLVAVISHPKYGFIESHSGNIYDIFQLAIEKKWPISSANAVFTLTKINEKKGVRAEFAGICKFRLGYDQKIEIHEEELEE